MTKIIGGTVSYEDGRKHTPNPDGTYPIQRKVRVELTFETDADISSPDEIEGLIAGDIAKAEVTRLLDGKAAEATAPQAPAATAAKPKAKAKAKPAAATPTAPPSGGPSDDDLGLGDTAPVVADAEDLSEFDLPASTEDAADDGPKEVTDADLNSAVTTKNAELKDAPKIRDLIGTYNTDPTKAFRLADIPQEKRAEFLAKLSKLKAGK
jgi:hypothetical protein